MSEVPHNLERITSAMADAASACGRAPKDITLVAVTKTHPAERVQEAVDAGHFLFGESRVQEAKSKIPLLPGRCRWHFLGHLQKNKIRQALPLFEMFHSIDSIDLAQDVDRVAGELGLFPRVLLEVNVAGESSKFGFAPEALDAGFEELLSLPRLQIEGLMTIPPLSADPESSRPFFARLRELKAELEEAHSSPMTELSMGMTNDYRVAIEEGATMVRVGTAIFGDRKSR